VTRAATSLANLAPPAEPGNELAVTHGAFATLRLDRRREELAEAIRDIVPASTTADEPTIWLVAGVLARIEAASVYIDEHGLFANGKGEPRPILARLSAWENTAAKLLRDLGCTPTSRAALGLDLARTPGAALAAYLEAQRRAEGGNGGGP
jgi:hypothetical protein